MYQVHVNDNLYLNRRPGATVRPVFQVARDGEVVAQEANAVVISGPSRMVYRPNEPLYPGGHISAWVETEGPIAWSAEGLQT